MKNIIIYELITEGKNVEEVMRIDKLVKKFKRCKIEIDRYNARKDPFIFFEHDQIHDAIESRGYGILPALLVEADIVMERKYPTGEEICEFAKIPKFFLCDKLKGKINKNIKKLKNK